MGGLIAAGYLLTDRPRPDLAVLTAPGLDSTLAGWKKLLAPLLGRIVPTLSVPNGVDPRRCRAIRRSVGGSRPTRSTPQTSTTRFGAEALAEQARVRAAAPRDRRPDARAPRSRRRARPADASSEVFEGAPGVERRTYPGLRHELHNEPEGPAIIDEVIAWLRERATLRGTTEHRLRGAPRALRVWQTPQTRRT